MASLNIITPSPPTTSLLFPPRPSLSVNLPALPSIQHLPTPPLQNKPLPAIFHLLVHHQ